MKAKGGFALLETVLALAIFATVATGMTVALDRLGESSAALRREAMLLRHLESALAEASGVAASAPAPATSAVERDGFLLRTEVVPWGGNADKTGGRALPGMYRVRVTGYWPGREERSLEVLVLNRDQAGGGRRP